VRRIIRNGPSGAGSQLSVPDAGCVFEIVIVSDPSEA
jgi:hypothetical protein